MKSKNRQGVPDSRKADEVRLYALRGGLTTKMVRTAHFRSHEVFRGDLILTMMTLFFIFQRKYVKFQFIAHVNPAKSSRTAALFSYSRDGNYA